METENKLLRRKEVETRCGLSRSSIYALLATGGDFPVPVKVSKRAVRWNSVEIETWLNSRPRSEVSDIEQKRRR